LPPDPDELLAQADALAGKPSPTQTDLRRAISAAYYALFHFTLTAAADMVLSSGARSSAAYSLIYRSVDHSRWKNLAKQITGSPIAPAGGFGKIENFPTVAANLYEQRILAEYNPSPSFTANEVNIIISNARQAIAWFQSGTQEQREAFLTLLLFKPR
jgi:hypothetical protein